MSWRCLDWINVAKESWFGTIRWRNGVHDTHRKSWCSSESVRVSRFLSRILGPLSSAGELPHSYLSYSGKPLCEIYDLISISNNYTSWTANGFRTLVRFLTNIVSVAPPREWSSTTTWTRIRYMHALILVYLPKVNGDCSSQRMILRWTRGEVFYWILTTAIVKFIETCNQCWP